MASLEQVAELARISWRAGGAGELERKHVENALAEEDFRLKNLESLAIQGQEVFRVNDAATTIETKIIDKGFPLPGAIVVFTGGFLTPEDATTLGFFGESPFDDMVATDTMGYPGKMSVVGIDDDQSILAMEGRVHPGEKTNENHGNKDFAHNNRVWQELVRRGRDGLRRKRPIEIPIILGFLTGVDCQADLEHGRMAVAMDDSELSAAVQPGAGPHAVYDEWFGFRHQAAVGRTSNGELVRELLQFAVNKVEEIKPAIGFGTPGAPGFESLGDTGFIRAAFKESANMDLLRAVLEPAFGNKWQDFALFYGMGITSEMAVWRQMLLSESDIRVPDPMTLALLFSTDKVGNIESLTVNHPGVLAEAFAAAEPYRDLIIDFARQIAGRPYDKGNKPNFSIRARLAEREIEV